MKKQVAILMITFCMLSMSSNAQFSPDYSNICVDSIWYEPSDPGLINVRLYNGDSMNLNYPSVQIISPSGDTISNRSNYVTFFAQLGMTYTTYTDTIYEAGITDWTGYTFVINELFGDTGGVISRCSTTGLSTPEKINLSVYPNPATDQINISCPTCKEATLAIMDKTGKVIRELAFTEDRSVKTSVTELPAGIYFIQVRSAEEKINYRLIKL